MLRATRPVEVPVAAVARPGIGARLLGAVKSVGKKVGGEVNWACSKIRDGLANYRSVMKRSASALSRRVVMLAKSIGNWLSTVGGIAWVLRKPLLMGVAVGITVGIGCYAAGSLVAYTFSGVASFAGSVMASTVNWWRQVWDLHVE